MYHQNNFYEHYKKVFYHYELQTTPFPQWCWVQMKWIVSRSNKEICNLFETQTGLILSRNISHMLSDLYLFMNRYHTGHRLGINVCFLIHCCTWNNIAFNINPYCIFGGVLWTYENPWTWLVEIILFHTLLAYTPALVIFCMVNFPSAIPVDKQQRQLAVSFHSK